MIEEPALSLARDANFAAFTTMLPSGVPMTHVMWVDCDGEHLLINTETHRAKFKNVEANPNVAVAIWDRNDPYVYAEVRGTVVETVAGETARRHMDHAGARLPYGRQRTPAPHLRNVRCLSRPAAAPPAGLAHLASAHGRPYRAGHPRGTAAQLTIPPTGSVRL